MVSDGLIGRPTVTASVRSSRWNARPPPGGNGQQCATGSSTAVKHADGRAPGTTTMMVLRYLPPLLRRAAAAG